MAASLCNHSCACIHQNNCQICRRAAGNDITGVLLMSRSVRNDKFTSIGGEVAISHINCNTLFAFSLQSIEQQCIVDMLTCISYTFTVAFQRIQLVLIQFLAVKQQATDQCRFSIIHRTGCQQPQQVFLFIFIQKSLYI